MKLKNFSTPALWRKNKKISRLIGKQCILSSVINQDGTFFAIVSMQGFTDQILVKISDDYHCIPEAGMSAVLVLRLADIDDCGVRDYGLVAQLS